MVRKFYIFIFSLLLPTLLFAYPKIVNSSLNLGLSRRLNPDTYCTFSYRIRNKDKKAYDLMISVKSLSNQIVYYSRKVTIKGERSIKDSIPIKAVSTDKYLIELIYNGNVIDKTEAFVAQSFGFNKKNLLFINDDLNLNKGVFIKKKNLIYKCNVFSYSSKEIPSSWIGLGFADIIVIQNPNFRTWSLENIGTVKDYVKKGGTLLFNDPNGIMKAYHSNIFNGMFPAIPIQIRKTTNSSFLHKWLNHKLDWKNGIAYMEMLPTKDSLTTLKYEDMPAIIWKRYGLGKVGISAVDPGIKEISSTPAFIAFWNHFLEMANTTPTYSSQMSHEYHTILEMLSGIKIPSVSDVAKYIFIYALIAITILLGGMFTKKTKLTWSLMFVSALAYTVFIFVTATSSSKSKSTATASFLTFQTEDIIEQLISLFSEKDINTALLSSDTNQTLGYMPSRPGTTGFIRSTTSVPKPFALNMEKNGYNFNYTLRLPARLPRYFTITSRKDNFEKNKITPPLLNFKENSMNFDKWKIPQVYQDSLTAFLILEKSAIPLNIEKKDLQFYSRKGKKGFLSLDAIVAELEKSFEKINYPAPTLVLIQKKNNGLDISPKNFSQTNYNCTMIPVKLRLPVGIIQIPSEAIRFVARDKSSRLLFRNGHFLEVYQRSKNKEYIISALLPAYLHGMTPEEITISLNYTNSGQNIEMKTELISNSGQTIKGISKGTTTLFKNIENSEDLIDPVKSTFQFKIIATTKIEIKNMLEINRTNAWKLRSIDISAKMKNKNERTF
ncbi:MAG: hypothetical protein U9O87_03020 [Verrucomicrobiota bacterium]|nr:hypothetical protein [Verrucomicrobiota bacterium]